jgi:DNA-binding CsgD family transcriptional regulator
MDLNALFLSKCFSASSILELNRLLSEALKHNGITRWAYVYFPDKENNRPLCYNNYPEEWGIHYFKNQCQKIDPILRTYTNAQSSYLWSDFLKKDTLSLAQHRFFKEARDFNLDEGITVPIFICGKPINSGLLTFVPENDCIGYYKFFLENELSFKILAHTYHSLVQQFHLNQSREDFNPLTPREQECLAWVAKGKTDYEIAIILGGLAKPTVTKIINNAKEKLDCYSRTSATVKAIKNHYITLSFD